MAFFTEPERQGAYGILWARRLYAALRRHSRTASKPTCQEAWAKTLAVLARDHLPSEVEAVLNWYCAHILDEGVPHVSTATMFVAKYAQIKAAWVRAPEEVVVDAVNVRTARRYQDDWPYPPELVAVLPELVSKSLDNLVAFRERVFLAYTLACPESSREAGFLLQVLRAHLHTVLPDWMRLLSEKYGRLEHYYGPPLGLAFRAGQPLFKDALWRPWALAWCGDARAFDDLLCQLTRE